MWSSRNPCSFPSAISRLTSRWTAAKVPASSTRKPPGAPPPRLIEEKKRTVVDAAGRGPPVAELVMLAFEQMVQRKRWRGAIWPGAVGFQPAGDDVGGLRDALQFGLEGRGFLPVGAPRPVITDGQRQHGLAGRALLRACLLDDHAQDFAVTFRRDRQAMLKVPG